MDADISPEPEFLRIPEEQTPPLRIHELTGCFNLRCICMRKRGLLHTLILAIFFTAAITNCCKSAGEECTLALISGTAAQDGRPLLWKNRDCPATAQEYIYSDSGQFSFIGVTNSGTTNQVWGGVNEAGFAIVDANAYNFADLRPGGDDDGRIMYWALMTCQTVEDFEAVMDSTDDAGRTLTAIYGVLDAYGQGAFFEAATYEHYRYDLDDSSAAPNGYMVRATFGYSGSPEHVSQYRHDRALEMLDSAYAVEGLSRELLIQCVARDLLGSMTNPYPLPFQGQEGSLPYGFINTNSENLINRNSTRSAQFIQGILPTENPLLTTLWAMVAEPVSTMALPLWVGAGSVPPEFDGPEFDQSELNLWAQVIRNYIYPPEGGGSALDTWRLVDHQGDGLLPFLFSLEDLTFSVADSNLNAWRLLGMPPPDVVESLQDSLATWALLQMSAWGPPESPEVDVSLIDIDAIQLDWEPVTANVFGLHIEVSGYTVYAFDSLFWNRLPGDSITTVGSPPAVISIPEVHRFYQVRCQP